MIQNILLVKKKNNENSLTNFFDTINRNELHINLYLNSS